MPARVAQQVIRDMRLLDATPKCADPGSGCPNMLQVLIELLLLLSPYRKKLKSVECLDPN